MSAATHTSPRDRRLTIGTVCAMLESEFPGISISKIRYLEDQKLLTPHRTPGGYRLYGEADVERLRTILRLQRDQFLPLRVIRDELAAEGPALTPTARGRRRAPAASAGAGHVTSDELASQTGATPDFLRELEEFSLIEADGDGYRAADARIVAAATGLAQFGVGARHLRAIHSAILREAGLLEQLLSPSLRSANPQRRAAGLEELDELAELCAELTEAVLVRDLRRGANIT
jgi:DNA-binding transcriptional MerR regulator